MAILRNTLLTKLAFRYIIPILSGVMMTGCYEDFNPESDTKPVLCLNSLITAGEPIEIEVTHTWMYNNETSEGNHNVNDAVITIIANDKTVESDYLPKEGDKIRVIAESPTYGVATAEVIVPHATPIGNVRVTPVVTDIWEGDNDLYHYDMLADITFIINIEMDINDPDGTDNFYRFAYNQSNPPAEENWDYESNDFHDVSFSMGSLEYDSEPIFKEHIDVFETIMGNSEDTSFAFFTDRQFSGKRYTLHLNFSNNRYFVRSQEYDESLFEISIDLHLITVSRSYYNWAVYKWYVDEGISGDLSDMGLAESKWGYSNVSTCAGVVAAQSSATFTIDLKGFLETSFGRIP